MSQSSEKPRKFVTVETAVATELKSVSKRIGSPSVQFLASAGLRYALEKIKTGELAVVNGELKQMPRAA